MKKITTILTLLVFTSVFSQIPSYVPINGLVGYWPFDGNANDESGNGNNGTVNGATLTTDRFGITNKAYSFVGANNINCGNSSIFGLTSSNILTFNFWTKSISSNFPYIQKYQESNTSNSNYFIGSSAPSINNSIRVTANGQNSIDFNAVLDQWINITVIYNGLTNSASFYLNGQFISTNNITFSNQVSTKSLIFGEKPNSFYPTPNGNLDDIGIWNRALTPQEITDLYNVTNANECQSLVINTGILSFNPVTYNNTVTVYPNPANDQITIDCGNLANVTGYQIKIVNTLGQEVFSGAMNTQQYVVPLNTWSGIGVYFVKIYDAANNLLNTKQIILQ
jgi:hypothetical protein